MSFVIRCLDCGHAAPFMPSSMHCPSCSSQWREAEYDLVEAAATFPSALKDRSFDLWRYRELLPIHNPNPMLQLGEGGTPLIQAANLGISTNPFLADSLLEVGQVAEAETIAEAAAARADA